MNCFPFLYGLNVKLSIFLFDILSFWVDKDSMKLAKWIFIIRWQFLFEIFRILCLQICNQSTTRWKENTQFLWLFGKFVYLLNNVALYTSVRKTMYQRLVSVEQTIFSLHFSGSKFSIHSFLWWKFHRKMLTDRIWKNEKKSVRNNSLYIQMCVLWK